MPLRVRAAAPLRCQGEWCRELGSSLYGALLDRAAADCEAGGPAWEVLEGREDDSLESALALRLMGPVHRLVLEGKLRDLALHYPSAGGSLEAGDSCRPFGMPSRRNGTGAGRVSRKGLEGISVEVLPRGALGRSGVA